MSGDRLRRWALRAATLGVAVIAVVIAAPPAWSHSDLARSDPPNGGMVAPGTTSIRLWFLEPVDPRVSTFHLVRPDGRRVILVASVAQDGGLVRLETDPLPIGSYRVDWRVLSLGDGHSLTGSLVFGAGMRPSVVPDAGSGRPPLTLVILRWVDLSAILVAIGALAVSGRVLGALGEAGRVPRRRARTIGVLAAAVAAYAGLVTPLIRTYAPGTPYGTWLQETWATLAETPWGHLWLAREAATVIAASAVWSWARRTHNRATSARLALAALAATALLEAWAGHASSLPRLSGVAGVVSAVHVVAAGVWAGGLGVLALCLIPLMRRHPAMRSVVVSSVWRTFGPMAAAASVVLVATGLYEAGRHVPDVASLAGTLYGGAVAGKLLLLVLALAMAGLNLMVANPAVGARVSRVAGRPAGWTPVSRHRFTRIVALEAVVLLVAVGLAAVLTTTPTAREVNDANRVTAPQAETADGLFITFEDVPAGPNRSRLVAQVRSTVLPAPAPVVGVDVELSGPAGVSERVRLARMDEGRFETETTRSSSGVWSATLLVHRRGLPDTAMQTTWTVAAPSGARVTRAEVIGTVLAVVLLLGLLTALVMVRRRRGRGAPIVAAPPQPEREVSLR